MHEEEIKASSRSQEYDVIIPWYPTTCCTTIDTVPEDMMTMDVAVYKGADMLGYVDLQRYVARRFHRSASVNYASDGFATVLGKTYDNALDHDRTLQYQVTASLLANIEHPPADNPVLRIVEQHEHKALGITRILQKCRRWKIVKIELGYGAELREWDHISRRAKEAVDELQDITRRLRQVSGGKLLPNSRLLTSRRLGEVCCEIWYFVLADGAGARDIHGSSSS
jgi:hypothetical protein